VDLGELLPRLQRLLRRTTPRLEADVPPDSDFRQDLNFDSIDLVEFVSRIEVEFALQIPDEELPQFLTIGAIASYLERRLRPGEPPPIHSPGPGATAPAVVTPSGTAAGAVAARQVSNRPRARIVITGAGVMTPLGHSVDELWSRLLAGESAVCRWPDLEADGYRVSTAARIGDFECAPLRRGRSLAVAAAEQAVAAAGITLPPDTGVFVGSTIGESLAFELAAEGRRLRLDDYPVSSFAHGIRRRFGLDGVTEAVGTACAAGNYAVGAAVAALREDRVPVALAGGIEPFSRLAMVGFSRSRAMATDACRPFDRRRNGMVLGEGAAVFVLERAERALDRGVRPLAEVVSLGLSADAYHPTAPEPSGEGMARAMRAALDLACLGTREIHWVNAHGSGTRASDTAEAAALHAVFGPRLPLVSGSKGALGHALGAASALELAICVQGLLHQTVPPTPGHAEADAPRGVACSSAAVPGRVRVVMNNAFAFGGLNSALILRAWEA
jgi:3-oxoacyl-[acyl-carrier-protein] synthase II